MKSALKILIVDDDRDMCLALSELVKRMGFKPVIATKPTDALNIVRLQTVHAAIIDILLPKMTGAELAAEFRQSKFGDNPIVFVSGVFRDKAFATETTKRTKAAGFIFKPFNNQEVTEVLRKALDKLINAEKLTMQSLLTRKLTSSRERVHMVENIEPIKGLDFPFFLGILTEVDTSGHLTIVNDVGEIFGVTVANGSVTSVDSSESQSTAILALIEKGFLSQEDWDEFQKSGNKNFSLERLVHEGYVSPHAIFVALKDQMLADLRAICSSKQLQINFVEHETTGGRRGAPTGPLTL